MNTRTCFLLTAVMLSASAALCATSSAVIDSVTFSGGVRRIATVRYTLSGAPAIVTLSAVTNSTTKGGGEEIDEGVIRSLSGDVNREVAVGSGEIRWTVSDDLPRFRDANCRFRLKLWAPDNPPDVMVVDLLAVDGTYSVSYYPSLENLPGGLLSNNDYRETKLVMKRVHAPVGGKYVMGSTGEYPYRSNETQHEVSLDKDYYLGVFECTQRQYRQIVGSVWSYGVYKRVECERRPIENICYNFLRGGAGYYPPEAPHPSNNILGLLRARTPYAFDLPTECQWEYACRAGNGPGKWNDGSAIDNAALAATEPDANLNRLARYYENDGVPDGVRPGEYCGVTNATAAVGSYLPNNWGFYDMHGNVSECCLDFYKADITEDNGALILDSEADDGGYVTVRGGNFSYNAHDCRSARRLNFKKGENNKAVGFRLCCPVVRRVDE